MFCEDFIQLKMAMVVVMMMVVVVVLVMMVMVMTMLVMMMLMTVLKGTENIPGGRRTRNIRKTGPKQAQSDWVPWFWTRTVTLIQYRRCGERPMRIG